jgi:hypothetical protein
MDFTCWLCGNLGALRRVEVIPGRRPMFVAFDSLNGVRIDRGEHVCPVCHDGRTEMAS